MESEGVVTDLLADTRAARPASEPAAAKTSHEQTLDDLRNLILAFVRLLPARTVIQKLITPILRMVARVLHNRGVLASNIAYDVFVLIFKWIINLFFREIRPRGAHNIPRTGPIIFVAAPHHNQFLDPLLLMSEVRLSANRRVSFLTAEKSMKRAFVGLSARIAQSIPVARAADEAKTGKGKIYMMENDSTLVFGIDTAFKTQFGNRSQIMLPKQFGFATVEVSEVIDDCQIRLKKPFPEKAINALSEHGRQHGQSHAASVGIAYKALPYIDQTRMYSAVYNQLKNGGCIGIFPEGGSHDRTDLLPLKHGVSIMALGAMAANPELQVQIVPVGLSYFHPHKFRSRAVVEFGSPLTVPKDLVEVFQLGGKEKREAVEKLMDIVYDGLKSVTLRAPDYETLMLIQASRRLYKPPGQQLNLSQIVELNRRFVLGYERYKDEPKIQTLKQKVDDYNKQLRYLGLKDHQVERSDRPQWKSLILLMYRLGLISVWTVLALPGVIINAPIFIAASIISRKKAKEAVAASTVKLKGRDVVSTWKVLVAMAGAPALYALYISVAIAIAHKFDYSIKTKLVWLPLAGIFGFPSVGYSALKFGEVGMDLYKSLPPLFLSLLPGRHKEIERLRLSRRSVAGELGECIEEFAPQLFDDFETFRIVPSAKTSQVRRKSSYSSDASLLSHPMAWLDEKLFGWSQFAAESKPKHLQAQSNVSESGPSSAPGAWTEPTTPAYSEAEDEGDYDEVVRYLDGIEQTSGGGGSLAKKRNKSHSALRMTSAQPSPKQATTSAFESRESELKERKGK